MFNWNYFRTCVMMARIMKDNNDIDWIYWLNEANSANSAWSAEWSAAYEYFCDELIKLLKGE